MKKLLFFLFSATALHYFAYAQTTTEVQTPIQHDKQFLLDYYQQTFDDLEQAVAGLNSKQLHYKTAPDKWSVSQCLEHIVRTEQMLLGYAKQTMAQAPNPERKGEVKMTDNDVIKGITDRSFKAQAPKEIAPEADGQYNNPGDALKELRSGRKEIIAYIESLPVTELRNHITDSPFGPVDGYHSFLYIPGHTARHTLQIKEVMADKNFPE